MLTFSGNVFCQKDLQKNGRPFLEAETFEEKFLFVDVQIIRCIGHMAKSGLTTRTGRFRQCRWQPGGRQRYPCLRGPHGTRLHRSPLLASRTLVGGKALGRTSAPSASPIRPGDKKKVSGRPSSSRTTCNSVFRPPLVRSIAFGRISLSRELRLSDVPSHGCYRS